MVGKVTEGTYYLLITTESLGSGIHPYFDLCHGTVAEVLVSVEVGRVRPCFGVRVGLGDFGILGSDASEVGLGDFGPKGRPRVSRAEKNRPEGAIFFSPNGVSEQDFPFKNTLY